VDLTISAEELADLLQDDASRPVVLLDVRWALGDTRGHERYLEGHLPGAVFVDLDRDLAGPQSAQEGRHPLPAVDHLSQAARRWGISTGSRVVVYDDWNSMAAARAWWLLRWAGLYRVALLDGGLSAWRTAGLPLVAGEVTAEPGDVTLSEGHLPTVDADGAARIAAAADGVLLDARASERYRGETEPIDPVAGHVPGALTCPTAATVDAAGRFLPPAVLRDRFAQLGVAPDVEVATYCGSGVTAAHLVLALTLAGFEDVALYPGSWSQWSNDPARPVATGA